MTFETLRKTIQEIGTTESNVAVDLLDYWFDAIRTDSSSPSGKFSGACLTGFLHGLCVCGTITFFDKLKLLEELNNI